MRTVTDLDMLITVEQLEDSPAALSLGYVCGNIGILRHFSHINNVLPRVVLGVVPGVTVDTSTR